MSENTEHHAPKTLKQKFFAALKNPPSLTHPKTLQGILLAAILISLPLTVYVAQIEQDPRQQAEDCGCLAGHDECVEGFQDESGDNSCPETKFVCDTPKQCDAPTNTGDGDGSSNNGSTENKTPDGQDSCDDNEYYCDNGTKIHKHGGYKGDDGQCVYAFDRGGSCTGGGNSGQGGTTGGQPAGDKPQSGSGSDCQNRDANGKALHQERGTNPRAEDGKCYTDADEATRKKYQRENCGGDENKQCQAAKDKWMEDTDAACQKVPKCVQDYQARKAGQSTTPQTGGQGGTTDISVCRNGSEGCNNPCSLNGTCYKDEKNAAAREAFEAQYCQEERKTNPNAHCQPAKVAWMTQADTKCLGEVSCAANAKNIGASAKPGTGGTSSTAKPATNPSGGYCVGNIWHDEATNNEDVDENRCGKTAERCMYSEAKQGETTCYLGECTKGPCGFNDTGESKCQPNDANFGVASFCPGKAPDNFASDDPAKLYNLCRQAAAYKSSQKACTNGENRAVTQADLDRLKKNWEAKAAQAATQPSSQTSSPGSSSPAGPRTGGPASPGTGGQPPATSECSATKTCPAGQNCNNGKCTLTEQEPAAPSRPTCPQKAFFCWTAAADITRICDGTRDASNTCRYDSVCTQDCPEKKPTPPPLPYSVPEGGACTSATQCSTNLYCSNFGRCTKRSIAPASIPEGGACTDPIQCSGNLICPNGQCVKP